jgi:lipoprotein-anchoring transpeptidase ErfK/SrfK
LRRHPRHAGGLSIAALLAAVAALSACTTGGAGADPSTHTPTVTGHAGSGTATPSSTPTQDGAPLAVVTAAPAGQAVNPITPVTVSVAGGTLSSVTLVNPAGKDVTGALSTDNTSWQNSEVLGYGKTYTLTAIAQNAAGTRTVKTQSFTTLVPGNMTMPYLNTEYGVPIANGGTYGVGMIAVVHFDEPITDRAAAERQLQVTTTPAQPGAWYWLDSQNLHWRPQTYYQPGTTVTITAKVYGHDLGRGLYGQSDKSVSFTIGRKQVTIADDTRSGPGRVKVYNGAGQVIRTMNTAMGEHTGTTVKGNYINFYTLNGAYTVLGHENPASMCSDSYGLPANAPGGYACENIPWATKISVDGIYLHELDTTVYAQNNGYDVSHGCLNLNQANAQWFYQHSLVGDPVIVKGAKGAPNIQVWQGGDWSVPWTEWVKHSALS